MTVSWLLAPVTAVAVLVTTGATALAQTPQIPPPEPASGTLTGGRPFRGMFGGGMQDTEQTLTFTGSLGGAYETAYLAAVDRVDDNVTAEPGGGVVGVGSAAIAYSLGRPRASVSASVTTSAFYYEQAGSTLTHSHRAQAAQDLQITQHTRLSASQYVSHQPFRLDRLFSDASDFSFGAPASMPTDMFAGDDEYLDLGAGLDLGQQLSDRLSLGVGYTYQSSQWQANSRRIFQGGRAGVNVSVSRGLSVRLGYGHYQSKYYDEEPRLVRHHNIDAGLDYSGAVSLTRRTTLSFGTGSTAIRDRHETHFRVTGRARIDREIGRSWNAGLAYARDAYYVDQLREIVFSDSVMFSVGGLINRRVSFRSGVGASLGDVGFSLSQNGAHATYAVAGIVTALTRQTAIGLDYNYYLHSFGTDITLPGGVQREVDRHSVRAYITVWAPLIARVRSQNASR